jgi:hypothetical protein
MSEVPESAGGVDRYAHQGGDGGFLQFIQQPRIVLILLAGWEIIGFLTELFVGNALFVENHGEGGISLDGLLAGRVLAWESIALAIIYLYCAREPERHRRIFWLAVVAQSVAVAAYLYHWLVTGAFSFESVAIPIAIAAGLWTLSFLNIFQAREADASVSQRAEQRDRPPTGSE